MYIYPFLLLKKCASNTKNIKQHRSYINANIFITSGYLYLEYYKF